jgi:hypothetical protein
MSLESKTSLSVIRDRRVVTNAEKIERMRHHNRRERARRRRAKPGTQLDLGMPETFGWGGARDGAGRPPGPRPRTEHRPRERFARWAPEHVTLRILPDALDLDTELGLWIFSEGIASVHRRELFRLIAYTLQGDHAHLVVEADAAAGLSRGMSELGRHLAWGVNAALERTGPLLDGRFHSRRLDSPAEVRNALGYLVENAARHAEKAGRQTPRAIVDPYTSLGHLELRSHRRWGERAVGPRITVPPVTWLLRQGWQLG